ncbi:MAG: glycosyltransferase, partial [Pseudomonadota bacterium]
AARHGDAIMYHDQDVLNCILKGRWGALAPIWNLHEMPHSLRTWECYSSDPDERRELIRAPRVVHFVSSDKPWHAICFHGFQQPQFLDALSRTEFRDYRVPDLPLGQRLFHYGLVYPSVLINWGLWRGLIHARDPQILAWLCQQILRRPWGLLTYPAWLCFMSLRDLWRARGRAP